MSIEQLKEIINLLHIQMDDAIQLVEDAAKDAQSKVYQALLDYITEFEIRDGRYIIGQNYTRRFAVLQRKIEEIIGEVFTPSVNSYLTRYDTVDSTNVQIQSAYNDIELTKSLLSEPRKAVYNQAEYFLKEAIADAYIQPTKFLLMQAVATGVTIKDAQRQLRNWDKGTLPGGKLTSGRPTPRLQAYASQIARDSIYSYNGTMQDIIAQEFKLTDFVFSGNIIQDSRPACVYMVRQNRTFSLDEVPKILEKYPDGIIPGTTKENYFVYRNGFGCRHICYPVKKR